MPKIIMEDAPKSIELGFDNRVNLYLRKNYFTPKSLIKPSHEQYHRLVGLLDDEACVIFLPKDVEFKFLMDIFLAENSEVL